MNDLQIVLNLLGMCISFHIILVIIEKHIKAKIKEQKKAVLARKTKREQENRRMWEMLKGL